MNALADFLLSLLDPKYLVSLIVALTGLIAGVRAWLTTRNSAEKGWVKTMALSLTKQIEFMDGRIAKLQSELDKAMLSNVELLSRTGILTSQVELLDKRVIKLQNDLDSALELNAYLTKQVETLRIELDGERKNNTKLTARVAELENSNALKATRITELEREVGMLNSAKSK